MPISKPDGFPTYAVVEDSPQRFVLQTRGSIYFPASIMLVFGMFFFAPYAFGGIEHTAIFVVSGIFFALSVFFVLRWRRLVFDASSRIVRFDSILFGKWKKDLGAIDGVVTDSEQRETTEKVGDTERTRYYTVYRAFLVINGEKVHLNDNKSAKFIEDIRSRVEGMKYGAMR